MRRQQEILIHARNKLAEELAREMGLPGAAAVMLVTSKIYGVFTQRSKPR